MKGIFFIYNMHIYNWVPILTEYLYLFNSLLSGGDVVEVVVVILAPVVAVGEVGVKVVVLKAVVVVV